MARIVFTRTERGGVITQRYGDFWLETSRGGLSLHGSMIIAPGLSGDEEFHLIADEFMHALYELADNAKFVTPAALYTEAWIKRGAGTHPKAGAFVAYKSEVILVKVTGANTELRATGGAVPGPKCVKELIAMFRALPVDREDVRQSSKPKKEAS